MLVPNKIIVRVILQYGDKSTGHCLIFQIIFVLSI